MVSESNKCPEQPSLFRRPGTTLIFECHQDDFYVSGSNVELAWLQENWGARLKLKPAEPMGPGSQSSYLRATRTRIDADSIHIARESYIENVLDLLQYRPDIAFAVHEVSKTLASLRRCRPPKIATTWKVSLGSAETWNHDTKEQ